MEDLTLLNKLQRAIEQFQGTKEEEEKFFLTNYIGNLYNSFEEMEQINCDEIFINSNNFKDYRKKEKEYNYRLLEEFVLNKSFHKDYLSKIIEKIDNSYQKLVPLTILEEDNTLTEKEFKEVLFLYLKSIHLEKKFDFLNIHFIKESYDDGYALYNPLTKDIDLFLNDFFYNLYSMEVLVHELGHAYDFAHFSGNVGDYNAYTYLTFYTEVLSMTLERNFLHFLLENGIKENATKKQFIYFENLSYDLLEASYLWTLLDNNVLFSKSEKEKENVLIAKAKEVGFSNSSVFNTLQTYDFFQIYNYCYGDILSMFLEEEIKKNGLTSDLVTSFMNKRYSIPLEEFLTTNDLSPKRYQKLYQQEITLIKK